MSADITWFRCFCGKYELSRPAIRFDNGDRHYPVQCIIVTPKVIPPAPEHSDLAVGDQMDIFEVCS